MLVVPVDAGAAGVTASEEATGALTTGLGATGAVGRGWARVAVARRWILPRTAPVDRLVDVVNGRATALWTWS